MNLKLFISFFILVILPINASAEWIRIFSIAQGDLYINSKSVSRNGNSISFDQLVDYNKKQSNGAFSFLTNSEVDCRTLKIRDLNYKLYKQQMAKGTNFYKGNPSKKWKNFEPGTSAYLVNKILCERVYKD